MNTNETLLFANTSKLSEKLVPSDLATNHPTKTPNASALSGILQGHRRCCLSDHLEQQAGMTSNANNLSGNNSRPSEEEDRLHIQRHFSRLKYAPDFDSFCFGIELGHPKRSATLPLNLQPKVVNRIKYEESDQMNSNPKRQETFGTENSESFEHSAPWDQKAILSLDGGGIRGYSALLIIKQIMEAIKEIEMNYRAGSDGPADSSYHPLPSNPQHVVGTRVPEEDERQSAKWLPCHYFDYMAGTSTGGLIAIMLGRLRMNIDDCIADYETLGGDVFGHPRWFHLRSPLWWPRDKYNHKVLETVIKDVVKHRAPRIETFPGGQNFSFDENRCRTVVVSYQQTKEKIGLEKPYLFRSYKNLHLDEETEPTGEKPLVSNSGEAQDIPIWQVARATSAAPGYFKPVEIDGLLYLDGGFGANNPCSEIVEEVRTLNNQASSCVGTVVSIGTGKDKGSSRLKNKGPTRFINFFTAATKWASDPEREHGVQRKNAKHRVTGFNYFRLNVEDGLGAMKLDEWKSRGRIRTRVGKGVSKLRCASGKTQGVASIDYEKAANLPEAQDWFQPKNTLDTIREHTEAYLQREDVQNSISELALILVKGRRERARSNLQRWEKACFGAWYQCKLSGCPRGEKEYAMRDKMAQHLLDKHKNDYSKEDLVKLNTALDDCKIVVL